MQSQSDSSFTAKSLAKSDAELILACRRGEESAWNELVERFQRLIITIPRRAGLNEEQSADIFQEVFLTLFEKLDEIEHPEKIRSWLVTTAKFKTWRIIRGDTSTLSLDDDESKISQKLSTSEILADEVLIQLEEQHLIRTALKQMEERCQKILTMIYLLEPPASYAQVALEIGVGETSISPMRARCLKKLAKILERKKY